MSRVGKYEDQNAIGHEIDCGENLENQGKDLVNQVTSCTLLSPFVGLLAVFLELSNSRLLSGTTFSQTILINFVA